LRTRIAEEKLETARFCSSTRPQRWEDGETGAIEHDVPTLDPIVGAALHTGVPEAARRR